MQRKVHELKYREIDIGRSVDTIIAGQEINQVQGRDGPYEVINDPRKIFIYHSGVKRLR